MVLGGQTPSKEEFQLEPQHICHNTHQNDHSSKSSEVIPDSNKLVVGDCEENIKGEPNLDYKANNIQEQDMGASRKSTKYVEHSNGKSVVVDKSKLDKIGTDMTPEEEEIFRIERRKYIVKRIRQAASKAAAERHRQMNPTTPSIM